jgi:Fe-S cluster biogenesis protein NfuA
MDFFVAGHPVLFAKEKPVAKSHENASDIEKEIIELIDARVRPSVAMDGGDIIFHSFKDGIVYLEMHGSCSGCPSSTVTLKQGIENMLKHYIPEVLAVEAVEEN